MKSLADRPISEILIELKYMEDINEIKKIYFELEGNIGGFTYRSIRGTHYIVINQNLALERQIEVAYHEAKHVIDCESHGIYICELTNNNYDIYEINADNFANDAMVLKLVSNFL